MTTIPYTFANQGGSSGVSIPASELDANFTALLNAVNAPGAVTACSTSQSITADQTNQTFSNAGAAGAVTLTLPTPVAGYKYTFICAAAQTLTLDISGSVVIGLGEIATTAGGAVSANTIYSSITLIALSPTLWVATSMTGSWVSA